MFGSILILTNSDYPRFLEDTLDLHFRMEFVGVVSKLIHILVPPILLLVVVLAPRGPDTSSRRLRFGFLRTHRAARTRDTLRAYSTSLRVL